MPGVGAGLAAMLVECVKSHKERKPERTTDLSVGS